MNTDIRLSVSFFDHPKTMKLRRKMGSEGVESLLRLWVFAAKERPAGVLTGMDRDDIELAARWSGTPLTFVDALIELRWIDVDGAVFSLHGWQEHNSWAASVIDRSDKARFSRLAKTYPSIYAELKDKNQQAITRDEYNRLTKPRHCTNDSLTSLDERSTENNDRSESFNENLTPAPAPAPKDIVAFRTKSVLYCYDVIIGQMNQILGTKYNPKSEATRKLIRARIDEGYTVEDFAQVCRNQFAAWGNDPKMKQYLRPATLFCASKMDGYLNTPMAARKATAKEVNF